MKTSPPILSCPRGLSRQQGLQTQQQGSRGGDCAPRGWPASPTEGWALRARGSSQAEANPHLTILAAWKPVPLGLSELV